MKKRTTDNFAVRLLGTLLLSSPFTLSLTRLHCIKFSIVQQVFKIEYLQSIFTNAEQRKLKLLGHCNYRKKVYKKATTKIQTRRILCYSSR